LPSSCPSGLISDGYGNCLPPITSISCASGFTKSHGSCVPIDSIDPPATVSCPSGQKTDGYGNCVSLTIPVVCDIGFHSDGLGSCLPDSVPVPSVCPSGYTSDGNGACVPIDTVLTACASGYTTDGQGGCVLISPSLPPPSVPTCPSGF